MRFLKYASVFLVILAVLAVGANIYRESIARNIANSALRDKGFTATDLSIESLRTDSIELSLLVLEQDDGASYRISGVTFPTSFPSDKEEKITIEKIVLMSTDKKDAAAPVARLLQMFLQLPDNVPNTEIRVAEVLLPDVPAIASLVWKSIGQQQQLSFRIDSINVEVATSRTEESTHEMAVQAEFDEWPDAFSAALTLHREDTGFTIDGSSSADISPWVPLLKTIGMIPADISSIDATLGGPVSAVISDDEMVQIPVNAQLSLEGELKTAYNAADGPHVRLRASSSFPADLLFEYPSLEWSSNVEQLEGFISIDAIDDLPVRFDKLACRAGIRCTFDALLDANQIDVDGTGINSTRVAASLIVTIDGDSRTVMMPTLTIAMTGIESDELAIASVDATDFKGAQIVIDADDWRFEADRFELVAGAASNRDGVIASAPASLRNIQFHDSGSTFSAEISVQPNTAAVSWNDRDLIMPGAEVHYSKDHDKLAASFELSDDIGALASNIDVLFDRSLEAVTVSVRNTTVDFSRRPLSGYTVVWPHDWDIVTGTWSTQADLELSSTDEGITFDGAMTNNIDEMSGNYGDVAFTGLKAVLALNLDSSAGIKSTDSTLEIGMLDVGIPLKNISANFAVDSAEETVLVNSISTETLGGQLVTDPFLFDLQKETNDLVLRPQSIQLQFIVDLAEFEDISLSGSISGKIPVTIHEKTVTISNGRLESDPPGGVISYLPGLESAVAEEADSGLGLVSRALANFQFNSLSSDVDYLDNGDLLLQMRLEGVNPDLDENQPVILNLGVENNIPELLRSLRATRSIEDIIEKRNPQIRR